jgi:hypothetical protein
MRRVLSTVLMVLAGGCASGEGPGAGDATGGTTGDLGISVMVGSDSITFTDVLAIWTGPPFNRLRLAGRRGADKTLEDLQITAAGSNPVRPGKYLCTDQSETGMFYSLGDAAYDADDCTITITQFGSAAGQETAGTFSGTVVMGTEKKIITNGRFRSKVMLSD